MRMFLRNITEIKIGLLGVLIIMNIVLTTLLINGIKNLNANTNEECENAPLFIEHPNAIDKWELFKVALKWQESKCKPEVGSDNAIGLYAITPIYVKECNNILGYEHFTLEDRYDSLKSESMFEVFQSQHNPKYSIERAIKLHNPTAESWYRNQVMDKYNLLKYFYSQFLGYRVID